MTAAEILKAMGDHPNLAGEVLDYLDAGMWDEWDIGLADGLQQGFAEPELQVAARTAAIRCEYDTDTR